MGTQYNGRVMTGLPLAETELGSTFDGDEKKAMVNSSEPKTYSFTGMISTLPVLVALPSMLMTYLVARNALDNDLEGNLLGVLKCLQYTTSILFAGCFLIMVKVTERTGFVAHRTASSISSTLWSIAALSIFYGAATMLPIHRICVSYLGLYLNKFNPYTAIAFIMDFILNSHNTLDVALGYVFVIGSFYILSKQVSQSRIGTNVPVILITMTIPALFLMLWGNLVSLAMLVCNFFTSIVFLLSLQDSDLKSSPIVSLVLSVLSCTFEYVIFSVQFGYSVIADILLPLTIRVDRSVDIATFSGTNPSGAGTSKSILTELLGHSDTRAIFNFLLLNFTFMFIQLLYSFRSQSLGLLSDSLHMALDCVSLALGLVAGVLSKEEIDGNGKYPFGYKNFEVLAGFTNGALLTGISGSIIFEAIGRLYSPVVLRKTNELFIVSVLGLLVNLVGIFAFNHGHAHSHGHSHGHSHAHSHGHSHGHSHDHSQDHKHSNEVSGKDENNEQEFSHEHSDHDDGINDNMKGIFLHVLADTLGSLGVVISTLLTRYFKWDGFDALASIVIAVLIFSSAVPLILSTASVLLLRLSGKRENTVRRALQGILEVPGVKSFTTPRFWPSSSNSLVGYVHIQVYKGENTAALKRKCEKVFRDESMDIMIQVENDYETCWCRFKDNSNRFN